MHFRSTSERDAFAQTLRAAILRADGADHEVLARLRYRDWVRDRAIAEHKAAEMRLIRLRAELRDVQLYLQYHRKYRPDQPRVPAGNPDGGQWTDEGGSSGGEDKPDQPVELTMGRLPRNMRTRPPAGTARRTEDIMAPDGKVIGQQLKGAGEEVRTVTREQFEVLKRELQRDAREITAPRSYEGRVFERPDGSRFGIRNSRQHGETLDIIRSHNPKFEKGFKVHFR